MPTRRHAISMALGSLMVMPAHGFAQTPAVGTVTEQQKGDPGLSYESVTFDPAAIRQISDSSGRRASFERWEPGLSSVMLSTARTFLGNSRTTTPGQIAEFLALFNLPMRDVHGDVAFCAAGLSFCALMAYAAAVKPGYSRVNRLAQFRTLCADLEHYYFYPTVSCVDMYFIAKGKRRWVDRRQSTSTVPKPGWVVLYDWSHRGMPDHCGLIQSATSDHLFTVEFNTSVTSGSQRDGGSVAEKTRTYEFVTGFIVTDAKPDLR